MQRTHLGILGAALAASLAGGGAPVVELKRREEAASRFSVYSDNNRRRKGRNKSPHAVSGIAVARRVATKRRNVLRNKLAHRRAA